MLNDTFHFEKDVAIEDLEEEIRENYSNDYMEGRAIHVFHEVMDILEYVPAGYSLDDEDDDNGKGGDENYDIDDLPEEEENIEEDDTMHWDDDEDEDDDNDGYSDKPYDNDDIDFLPEDDE